MIFIPIMNKKEIPIDRILSAENIFMLYHPVISLKKKAIIAYEALGRCRLTHDKIINPGTLFLNAGKQGKVLELDRLFRRLAMAQFAEQRNHMQNILLSINFHTKCIDLGVVGSGQLLSLAQEFTLHPHNIIIEILESQVQDQTALQEFTRQYKSYGFLIAIDDIGSGYSNLDRIMQIQPDIIKIDASLIKAIHRDYYKQVLVKALTDIAHKIGALVVAEGVQTEHEVIKAQDLGIDLFQGYYFTRPHPLSDIQHEMIHHQIEFISDKIKQQQLDCLGRKRQEEAQFERLICRLRDEISRACPCDFDITLFRLFEELKILDCVYLLDNRGIQVSQTITGLTRRNRNQQLFSPANIGTDHSLKEYFLSIKSGRKKFVSIPYISLASGNMCITLSAGFQSPEGNLYIICADINDSQSPPVKFCSLG